MKLILAILLVLCLARMPYSYYMVMRVIACIIFALLAFNTQRQENGLTVALIVLLIVFQPILKAPFNRQTWNTIDVMVAIGLLIWISIDIKKFKKIENK